MNKSNLILLGAFAQKKFGMLDNFKVVEIPSDSPPRYRAIIKQPKMNNHHSPYAEPLETEIIELEKLGYTETKEFIWCGYSQRANVLVIQESN